MTSPNASTGERDFALVVQPPPCFSLGCWLLCILTSPRGAWLAASGLGVCGGVSGRDLKLNQKAISLGGRRVNYYGVLVALPPIVLLIIKLLLWLSSDFCLS